MSRLAVVFALFFVIPRNVAKFESANQHIERTSGLHRRFVSLIRPFVDSAQDSFPSVRSDKTNRSIHLPEQNSCPNHIVLGMMSYADR